MVLTYVMAELPKPSKSERPAGSHRHKIRVSILAILALCSLFFVFRQKTSTQKIVWLNASTPVSRASYGPLTVLKWKLEALPGVRSLVADYHNRQPKLRVESTAWQFAPDPQVPSTLGTAFATNAGGTLAWILPASRARDLRQQFDHQIPPIKPIEVSSIFTANNVAAESQMGYSVSVGGSVEFAGLMLSISPQSIVPVIQMSIGASSTELVHASATSPATLQTNLSIACNVLLTNGDSLVVESLNLKNNAVQNYWLIMTPSAVDSAGKPIASAP
jgi:hypothetical protein